MPGSNGWQSNIARLAPNTKQPDRCFGRSSTRGDLFATLISTQTTRQTLLGNKLGYLFARSPGIATHARD
jgi:hypothetical protein